MELTNLSTIRSLMAEAGVEFRKEFGQNFLINPLIPERIAEAASPDEDAVILEIGPGIGTLTQELCRRYARVIAIEIDDGLIPILHKTMAEFDNFVLIHGDCMKLDLSAILAEYAVGKRVSVCANLPYYITTPILMRLLESNLPLDSITVMIQSEVADRLTAAPGSAEYGAITATLGYYGETRRLFTVSAGNFLPAPKVNSAVVQTKLYKEKPFAPLSEAYFHRTVKAAFAQRRKTLVNALSAGFSNVDKATLTEILTELGHSPTVRGERLSTGEFVALSDALYQQLSK